MNEASSTLIAHKGCEIVPFSTLEALPIPEGTDTFKPVPHATLVLSMKACLEHKGYLVAKEQYAINEAGSRLFGTFDLSNPFMKGIGACVGFRQGIDRSMKIQIIAGGRIFVCDNMAFSGSFIALNRKHTAGLNLLAELMEAFNRYFEHLEIMQQGIADLQGFKLSVEDAKTLIFDAFIGREVMPLRYMRQVAKAYFEPEHPEFIPDNAWSLHNAFTETIKVMPLNLQLGASQRIGQVFDLGVKVEGQEIME